jgi:hypothetical protein
MHLIILTSLDVLSRNTAASLVADEFPHVPVVLHDLLDGGVVMRRIHSDDQLIERESTVLEHGCLSCTVRFDLAPALLRLAAAGETRAIVGLPPGTTAENAIDGLRAVAPGVFTVDTVALAARPEDIEDQLWDHHTLFGSGYTAVPEDSRTPGEFLMGELLFADTILTTSSELIPDDAALSARGLQLLRELAPHARLVPGDGLDAAALGSHSSEQARNRNLPGAVPNCLRRHLCGVLLCSRQRLDRGNVGLAGSCARGRPPYFFGGRRSVGCGTPARRTVPGHPFGPYR